MKEASPAPHPLEPATGAAGGAAFPPTQWSIVARACSDNTPTVDSRRALETLCRRYWYPLYAFVRRQGRAHHEAEDCTQGVLAHLIATHGLHRAAAERGRFRTFLLASLRNHMTSEWRRGHALRRGGGAAQVPLDLSAGEERFGREPQDPALTPEQAYDRAWARDLIRQATGVLKVELEKSGRARVFAALEPLLFGNADDVDVAARAAAAGMSPGTFHVAVHRARRRVGEILREIVAETVADPAEVDNELRHLIQALS